MKRSDLSLFASCNALWAFACSQTRFCVQGLFLLICGGPGLGLWGADPTSAMRPEAWTYLSIRGLGAPFTVILLVLQVACKLFTVPYVQSQPGLLYNLIPASLQPVKRYHLPALPAS